MTDETRELLVQLFELLDMQDGEWPGTHVHSTTFGRVWGTLPEDVTEILTSLYQLAVTSDE